MAFTKELIYFRIVLLKLYKNKNKISNIETRLPLQTRSSSQIIEENCLQNEIANCQFSAACVFNWKWHWQCSDTSRSARANWDQKSEIFVTVTANDRRQRARSPQVPCRGCTDSTTHAHITLLPKYLLGERAGGSIGLKGVVPHLSQPICRIEVKDTMKMN